MFGSLFKAALGVALAPVALAVDVVSLPVSAMDTRKGPFDNTEKVLDSVSKNVERALD